jgi:hypothetical protein
LKIYSCRIQAPWYPLDGIGVEYPKQATPDWDTVSTYGLTVAGTYSFLGPNFIVDRQFVGTRGCTRRVEQVDWNENFRLTISWNSRNQRLPTDALKRVALQFNSARHNAHLVSGQLKPYYRTDPQYCLRSPNANLDAADTTFRLVKVFRSSAHEPHSSLNYAGATPWGAGDSTLRAADDADMLVAPRPLISSNSFVNFMLVAPTNWQTAAGAFMSTTTRNKSFIVFNVRDPVQVTPKLSWNTLAFERLFPDAPQ